MGENSLENQNNVPAITMNTIEKIKNKPLKRTITQQFGDNHDSVDESSDK